ncbi:MAG: hypothetical protein AAGN15_07275 [Cyanobacteria bacterium J06581_3]
MVKASSQIEKELGLLQQRTEDMAETLEPLYQGYLKALAEASKQQLMAAAYHLCTQAYPDKFLSLSWQQRNQLQRSLQKLATQIHVQLVEQRAIAKKNSRKPQRNNGLAFLQRLLEARSEGVVVQTREGSRDDLLDKLSELAQLNASAGSASDGTTEEATEPGSPRPEPPREDDWQSDVPPAEPVEGDGASSDDIDFESLGLSGTDELSAKELGDEESGSEALGSEELGGEELAGEALDFEMDIPAAEQRLTVSEEDDLLGALEALARRSMREEPDEDSEEAALAPVHLAKQQVLMEKAIRDVFKAISEEANEILQTSDVMPNFPKALMAAAADSRGVGEMANAVPNVVKVSVRVMHGEANFDMLEGEAGDDGREPGYDSGYGSSSGRGSLDKGALGRQARSRRADRNNRPPRRLNGRSSDSSSSDRSQGSSRGRRSSSSHGGSSNSEQGDRPSRRFLPANAIEIEAFPEFAVINLQLSEVEFTDPRVSVWRNRLRKEFANLKQLGMKYQKTQRSLETAKAEDAWRSSWTALEES